MKQRVRKTTEKVIRRQIASITRRRWWSNAVKHAKQLDVAHATGSSRLKSVQKIFNVGTWVPHELTKTRNENRKPTCGILLHTFKRKSFCIESILPMKNGCTMTTSRENVIFRPWLSGKIYCKAKLLRKEDNDLCFLGSAWCYPVELLKPDKPVDGPRYEKYLSNLTIMFDKNAHNFNKDTTN